MEWSGLSVDVADDPRPPPNCPTITSEVGTVLEFANDRLLVRLTVSPPPAVGTVMTTGDHPAALGFSLAHVAVEPATAAPQL
jgi:hypothetical protein